MIDHLIRFAESIDISLIGLSLPASEQEETAAQLLDGGKAFGAYFADQAVTLLPIKIINSEAIRNIEGAILTPQEVAQGHWIAVRAGMHIKDWHTDPRLVAVTDNQLANAGKPFVLYKNDTYPWEIMQGRVWPTFAGSKYPFGEHLNESQLVA